MTRYSSKSRLCRSLMAITALMAAVMLTGCARAVVVTTVHPDGSYTRHVKYVGSAGGGGGMLGMASMFSSMSDSDKSGKNKSGKNGLGDMDKAMAAMQDVGTSFVLPHGAPWVTSRTKEEDTAVYTAEQQVAAAGSLQGDVAVKDISGGKSPLTSNTVTVRQIAPNQYEYREVIHWTGPPPSDNDTPDKDLIVAIKRALPPGLGIDANAIPLAKEFDRDFVQCLFGPPEPMMGEMMQFVMLPDLMERKIFRAMGPSFIEDIAHQLGDKLTREQQIKIARSVLRSQIDSISSSTKSGGMFGGGSGKSNSPFGGFGGNGDNSFSMASLTFSAVLPGKVTETNGEYDPVSGEVYWSLYAFAAQQKDVVLRAVCDTTATTAAR